MDKFIVEVGVMVKIPGTHQEIFHEVGFLDEDGTINSQMIFHDHEKFNPEEVIGKHQGIASKPRRYLYCVDEAC